MKQMVEVEVPEGYKLVSWHEIPNGCAYPTSRFVQITCGDLEKGPYFSRDYILIEEWKYPEWLGGCCVYQQEDGTWWVSAEIPPRLIKTGNCKEAWFHARTTNNHQSLLTKECFPGWEPPPCKDWKQSLHLNPRRECCGTS